MAQVGTNQSFFDLGGDSLAAMRLTARIRTVLNSELSVRDVFTTPTVAGLAVTIDQNRRGLGCVAGAAGTARLASVVGT